MVLLLNMYLMYSILQDVLSLVDGSTTQPILDIMALRVGYFIT